jgi:ABC-type sugar transport system ATPase subunit
MNYALEMKNITKEFPGVKALNNVTFNAYPGEILALMGENGAGKSTLMKVLSGSYPQTSYTGEIWVHGKQVYFQDTAQSEDAGIAMIYQEISMHLDLSVAENLILGRWPVKRKGIVDWKAVYSQAAGILSEMELNLDPRTRLRNLSTSQMQIISIVRALHKKPSILVLDEPTSALTETEARYLYRILHKLKSQGISCILISHKMEEVFQNADRVTILRDGNIVSTYTTADVKKDTVINDMVGRSYENYYPKRKNKPGGVCFRAEHFSVPHPFTSGKNIVEDVSIELRRGEILGLGGLIGAGRSELVSAIIGKTRKISGEVFLNGKRLDINSPKDAIENGISIVTEDRKADGFVGLMSIRNNISLASLKKISTWGRLLKKKEKTDTGYYFKKMDIRAPSINAALNTLSGGNQQKVVVGKCLMTQPQILIMDEPTRGIDVSAKHQIYNIMVELASQGIAIVMISSEMPELISMADRIVVLSEGRNAGELTGSEITQNAIMEKAVAYM